jgi:hypothetical protein
LSPPDELSQFGVKPDAGVARRRIRLSSDRRENLDKRFLFRLRLGNAAIATFAHEKPRQQIKRRRRGGESDTTERQRFGISLEP